MLGRLSQRDSRRVLLHLLPGCASCREVTAAWWSVGDEDLPAPVAGRFRYDGTLERVYDRVRHARAGLEAEREQAKRLLAELETRSSSRWLARVQGDARHHTWGFCELLLDRSEAARRDGDADQPGLAELCAGLAVAVAGRIDPQVHPRLLLEELRARAWTAYADARRAAGDLAAAEESLRRAEAHLLRGTGDRLEKARLLERKAVLRAAQDRHGDAARLLSRAILLYRRAGQWDRVGRVLFDLGCIRAASGDVKAALPALGQGLALAGRERSAGLLWVLSELVRGLSARLRR